MDALVKILLKKKKRKEDNDITGVYTTKKDFITTPSKTIFSYQKYGWINVESLAIHTYAYCLAK